MTTEVSYGTQAEKLPSYQVQKYYLDLPSCYKMQNMFHRPTEGNADSKLWLAIPEQRKNRWFTRQQYEVQKPALWFPSLPHWYKQVPLISFIFPPRLPSKYLAQGTAAPSWKHSSSFMRRALGYTPHILVYAGMRIKVNLGNWMSAIQKTVKIKMVMFEG